jgi:ABC-2 type transport system permease protein
VKKLFAIAWKDAVIRFSSPSELIFFIILPLVFTFLLAGGTSNGDQDPRIRLLVVDEAKTSVSTQIVAELEKSTAVRPEVVARATADDQFETRRASAVLTLPAGLDVASLDDGSAAVDLQKQPNNINAMVVERAAQTAIRRVSSAVAAADQAVAQAEKRQPFASARARQDYFDSSLALAQKLADESPERVTTVQGATQDRVEYDPRANSSAGQLVTWVFIPLFGISGLFAYERQQGTLRRLLTTPTGKAVFLLGAIGGQVAMALVQMLLLIGFGTFVMKLDWGRDPAGLAVLMVAAALAAGAIGTTLGTFVKSERQASGLSVMLGMVMALMGGCWYPLELFPQFVQTAVKILPTTWAMQGLLDLVLRGRGLVDILPEAGVLLGFAALFFVVGVWRFRYE